MREILWVVGGAAVLFVVFVFLWLREFKRGMNEMMNDLNDVDED